MTNRRATVDESGMINESALMASSELEDSMETARRLVQYDAVLECIVLDADLEKTVKHNLQCAFFSGVDLESEDWLVLTVEQMYNFATTVIYYRMHTQTLAQQKDYEFRYCTYCILCWK